MSSNGEQHEPGLADVRAMIHSMVAALSPPGHDDAAIERALRAAAEMEASPAFLQTAEALFDPARVQQRPDWGIQLSHPRLKTPHMVFGPKRLGDPGAPTPSVAGFALVYGIFTSPMLRAVLLLHGYQIGFAEPTPPPTSKIITRA